MRTYVFFLKTLERADGFNRLWGSRGGCAALLAPFPAMDELSQRLVVEGITNWEALSLAIREVALPLAQKLDASGRAYRKLHLQLELEDAALEGRRDYPRPRVAANLESDALALARRLKIAGPVWALTVGAKDLVPAPAAQMHLFNQAGLPAQLERQGRLARAWDDLCHRYPGRILVSPPAPSWRERMLAFYDPWRRERG